MDFNKYLKRLEQFQKQMDRLYEPLKDQSRIISQHLDPFKSVMADQMSTIENSLAPAIEVTKQYQMLMNQISIDVPNLDYLQSWQQSIERLANSPLANLDELIPDALYDSLLDLGSELEKVQEYQEGSSEIQVEITERKSQIQAGKKITWIELTNLILAIWAAIYMIHSDNASSVQREEQISELKLQNELKEKQLEETKKQTLELNNLTQAINEQTKIEKERYEQQQRFEENFNAFIESLEPYIIDHFPNGDD